MLLFLLALVAQAKDGGDGLGGVDSVEEFFAIFAEQMTFFPKHLMVCTFGFGPLLRSTLGRALLTRFEQPPFNVNSYLRVFDAAGDEQDGVAELSADFPGHVFSEDSGDPELEGYCSVVLILADTAVAFSVTALRRIVGQDSVLLGFFTATCRHGDPASTARKLLASISPCSSVLIHQELNVFESNLGKDE
jgi:hypothetical protein